MKIWRMSFRCGNQGYEMWPHCRELGVAAITYAPLHHIDLTLYPPGEPQDLWAKLTSSQKASLRRVAYEMREGDIIYVKQGPRIVGRGIVKGPYRFDHEYRLRSRATGNPWSHQRAVDWDSNFEPIDILLGAEPLTVLELSGERLRRLETALMQRLIVDKKDVTLPEELDGADRLFEGVKRQVVVNTYERDPEARKRCLAHYGMNCFVCGFNFADVYGESGKGLIHVHHLTPLSQVGKEYEVDPVRDLRPVCPNCHAVIHRRDPPYSIEEVKQFLYRSRS